MAKNFVSTTRLELFLEKLKAWLPTWLSNNSYVKDASYTHTDSNFTAAEKTKLEGIDSGANKYTLPVATADTLGGVKQGNNISIASDGTISATEMAWENVKNKPTKLSDFENDGVFITKAVNDLTNYYKKSEVYTQEEVNTLLSGVTGISVEVVDALPTSGKNGVIYLVAHSHGTGDAYDEYVWVASTAEFEKIGSTDIDLSNYWTKTDLVECTEDEIVALFS
jgi:hypothetical protein